MFCDDIAKFYKVKCAVCHGKNAEKIALGNSKILASLTEEEIIKTLNGYKNGSYGNALKRSMLPVVADLNQTRIEELAKFIKEQL